MVWRASPGGIGVEPFSTTGIWSYRESTEPSWGGTLEFDPVTGCTLSVFRPLEDLEADTERPQVIHGIVEARIAGGPCVRLPDPHRLSQTIQSAGLIVDVFRIGDAIFGPAPLPANATFEQVRPRFARFGDWFSTTGFEFASGARRATSGEFSTTWRQPDDTVASIALGDVSLGVTLSHRVRHRHAVFDESPHIVFDLRRPCGLNELERTVVQPLEYFLSLALDGDAGIDGVEVVLAAQVTSPSLRWFVLPESAGRRTRRRRTARDGLFDLSDVRDSLTDVLSHWFATVAAHRRALDIFFARVREAPPFVELDFSALYHAAVAFAWAPGVEDHDALAALFARLPASIGSDLLDRATFPRELVALHRRIWLEDAETFDHAVLDAVAKLESAFKAVLLAEIGVEPALSRLRWEAPGFRPRRRS